MPPNAALRRLIDREQQYGLWRRELIGFPVWRVERLRAYRHELMEGDREAVAAKTQKTGLARVRSEIDKCLTSAIDLAERRRASLDRRDIWVMSNSMYRRGAVDGRPLCIFAEHLREQLGDRLLFVEFNEAGLPLQHSEDLCFIDALQVPVLTASKVLSRIAGPILRAASAGQAQAFGDTYYEALDQALYGRAMYELAKRWLARFRPRALFVVCAYQRLYPMQVAARELGIPIIELQHGVIHESHAGYLAGDLTIDEHARLAFPDHIVVFGEYFGRLLERESAWWKGRWSVGGHPWLKRARRERPVRSGDGKLAVFFSQYELPVRNRVRSEATALRAKLGSDWRVTIKPHPREVDTESFYASALESGVELLPSRADTYELLGHTDLAISVYSTVAIEALAFGCRSVVLESPHWTEAIAQLVSDGLLDSAQDADDLAALAARPQTASDRASMADDLFGISCDPPDFAELVERLAQESTPRSGR